MPVPPNTTPATAIVISALPYSQTISAADMQLAPASGFVPTCGTPKHTVWYQITGSVTQTAIGITVFDAGGDCGMSVWLGPAGAPTQIPDACGFVGGALQINTNPGVDYFIALDAATTTVTNANTIDVVAGAANVSAAGNLLVTNDAPGFPATVLSASDGSILWTLGLPSCEMGDIVPDGAMCLLAEPIADANLAESINVYDENLQLVVANTALVIANMSALSPVRSDNDQTFYILCQTSTFPPVAAPILKTISAAGVAGATWTLPVLAHQMSELMAPNRANTIVYYGETFAGDTLLHRYDLIGNAPLADLPAIASITDGRDILILGTGELLIGGLDGSAHMIVTRITTAGSVQATYDLGAHVDSVGRLALALDDPNSFWVMHFPSSGVSRFTNVKVSDGSPIAPTPIDIFNWEPNRTNHGQTFGPSQSCPLLVLAQEATPPEPVACDAATVLTQPASQFVELGTSVTICSQFVVPGSPRQCQIDYVGPIVPVGAIFTGCGTSDPGTITLCLTVPVVTQTFTFNVTVTICPGEEDEVSTTSDDATVTVTSSGTGPGGGMRRLRRFKLPTKENKEVFFSRLQILLQSGVGLSSGQGSDPQMMIRLSKNGGKTWGTSINVPAGKQGQFSRRALLRQLGRARNAVVEISVTDPVYWALLAAYVELEEGTS